ncbi:MAG: folylpolyglutamate synthase/dihydrofolate synthase family protein [Bacteroidota bacterium]
MLEIIQYQCIFICPPSYFSYSMTYTETLHYLYHRLPMFQRLGPAAMKANLNNIKALCKALGQPQKKFPSIHIAGTNGKGSTAHLLSAVLQAKGWKVGLHTSPHYRDFRERIKIDGQLMPKKEVVRFVEQHQALFESLQPSFFEITVAMTFDYFARQKVDIAVIETGLGGRLDSTNILQPLLSIITNISFDHQQFLGNTLVKIAVEKAGIIKKQVPVVIGEEQKSIKSVFERKAKAKNASLFFASRYFKVEKTRESAGKTICTIKRRGQLYLEEISVDLLGAYQEKNIATALMALEVLQKKTLFKDIDKEHIQQGLAQLRHLTHFMGRWQYLGQSPRILTDSAHNEAGLAGAMEALENQAFERLHFVFGTVSDKDLAKVLPLLPSQAIYYFAKANIPRGCDPHELQEKASTYGLEGKAYRSVRTALAAAKRRAGPGDLIFVGGSIFVVAEVI